MCSVLVTDKGINGVRLWYPHVLGPFTRPVLRKLIKSFTLPKLVNCFQFFGTFLFHIYRAIFGAGYPSFFDLRVPVRLL